MSQEPNVWTFVKQILSKSRNYEYDPKKAKAYIICLILSYDPKSLPVVSDINPYLFNLNDRYIYEYLFEKVPSGSRFINYVKSQKSKENNDKNLQELKGELNLSYEEAKKIKRLINNL
jgi:hypothetical protein